LELPAGYLKGKKRRFFEGHAKPFPVTEAGDLSKTAGVFDCKVRDLIPSGASIDGDETRICPAARPSQDGSNLGYPFMTDGHVSGGR
jgi:hypothetical protein